jgi:hypothetical protein
MLETLKNLIVTKIMFTSVIDRLVAAVQRHRLTPSTGTTKLFLARLHRIHNFETTVAPYG